MDFMVRKKNIILLIAYLSVLWIIGVSAGADLKVARNQMSDEELFLQGQEYYQKNDYTQALSCYQKMKQRGRAVFYNRGNCYKYINDPVQALVNWHCAQKGASYAEYDVLAAQSDALKQEVAGDQSAKGGIVFYLYHFFKRLGAPFSLLAVQILFLCSWYTFFILLRYYRRSGLFLLFLLCILMSIFFLGGTVWAKYRQCWYKHAFVRIDTAPLFAGPHNKYQVLLSAHFTDELIVCETIPGWCRVEACNGLGVGWIEDTAIEIAE